ncbi:hypothetical protein DPMN_176712 [Dreissena polymorpha]|uniref:Uncharacterized protein n=1 Tax=Dreissena polymorpha TaxID=45954 RepID=A0A9D4IH61_DREPO|nr:hypothetical protein DPMN_176712 [Dreissena polymorpha]
MLLNRKLDSRTEEVCSLQDNPSDRALRRRDMCLDERNVEVLLQRTSKFLVSRYRE